ncbi:hypothetical protein PIB30_069047 [Stylosanthes scabra]|uniref:Uncharacterized protein n=1 Tax=Stylosanthes scabra TaxID=79078 RepID=A0ABU6WLE0_9FABA|nr:hypothetical protein [Stylosanthes scabra]
MQHTHDVMFQCYQQTLAQVPVIELYINFEVVVEVQDDPELDIKRQTVLQENLSDTEDKFEANYEVGEED